VLSTDEQARLSEDFVEDGHVQCSLHRGMFCIRTGEP
jgi:nitrite reductase/ring-hydroxylating ferredoxin subunit